MNTGAQSRLPTILSSAATVSSVVDRVGDDIGERLTGCSYSASGTYPAGKVDGVNIQVSSA
jgi:hypothetical protein